jgi:hypothetical protein
MCVVINLYQIADFHKPLPHYLYNIP